MNKKIKIIMLSSLISILSLGLVVIVPCLIIMDFFGANTTDKYVENNEDYADMYRDTLNKAIKNGYGYVPLNRILYFYLEDDSLSFYQIYIDNIDKTSNKLLEISSVCEIFKYRSYEGCKNIDKENQIDEEQNKPFVPPLKIEKMNVSSFFMEERVVFGKTGVHHGWDFAIKNETPVYSVCDGTIKKVSFPFKENVTNKQGGGGNQIHIECPIDEELTYTVIYMHLYPESSKVNEGADVKAGDEIASVGTTGYSTGPHLHYQVQIKNEVVDGMSLINFSEDSLFFHSPYQNGSSPIFENTSVYDKYSSPN